MKLNDVIGADAKKEKQAGFAVTMLHYTKLIPSESNNYSTDSIRELAYAIKLSGGIKQNLLARKKSPDEYELIAGHRRRLAIKYLVEDEGLSQYAMVPVHIEKSDDLMAEIDLILTNASARSRSDWEKMMEVSRLNELMQALKSGNEEEQEKFRELFGADPDITAREMRKIVAEKLGLSETKTAQLKHISNALEQPLMDRFESGEIGISVANAAASLPPEEQAALAEQDTIRLSDIIPQENRLSEAPADDSVSESDTVKDSINFEIPLSSFGNTKQAVLDENYEVPGQMNLSDIVLEPETGVSESDTEVRHVFAAKTQQKSEERCENCSGGSINHRWRIGDEYSTRQKYCDAVARMFIKVNYKWMQEDFHNRVRNVTESEKQFKVWFRKGGNYTWYFTNPEGNGVAHVNLFDDYIQFWNGTNQCVGDCDWFYLCASVQNMWNVIAIEAAQKGVEEPEHQKAEVIDAKFHEMQDGDEVEEPKQYDRNILESMIADAKRALNTMQDYWKENQPHTYTKYIMQLQALSDLLTAHESSKPEDPEPEQVEQPELPLLKNNDQRTSFIDAYETWPVWIETKETGEKYYRYDLPDGTSIVVKVYHAMLFDYKVHAQKYEERFSEGYGRHEYYLLHDGKFFRDCETNRSALIEKLKEIQKKGK